MVECIKKMWHIYNGTSFSHEKEGNLVIGCNIVEPWGHFEAWNKPVTEGRVLHCFTYISEVVRSIETEYPIDPWPNAGIRHSDHLYSKKNLLIT